MKKILKNLFAKMGKLLLVLSAVSLVFVFFVPSGWAATYYMPDDYANLHAAFSAMTGSDTLIIRDGTYTGATNIIDSSHLPHAGTSENWTIVKAENPGKVFFGDADVNTAYYYTSSNGSRYTEFQGIIWLGGGVMNNDTDYVKFTQCGNGSNLVDTGNSAAFSIFYSSYVLAEDCFAWGGRRYMFLSYRSDHIIFRRCVGRHDAVNTLHDSTKTEPIGGVSIYWSSNCEAQNCIIIDSDTEDYWTYESLVGAFSEPNMGGSDNYFRGCIALNNTMPLHAVHASYTNSNRSNIIGWDIWPGALLRGASNSLDHCTIGGIDAANSTYAAIHNYEGSTAISNSILTGISGTNAVDNVTSDYNCFYNNNNNYSNTTIGAHDQTTINPLSNSLLYLPRIEDSSDLDGDASDSGDIGATVLKKIGVSGALWGEKGYATTTDENLWPWPNEDIIQENMRTYSHPQINSKRGFCADGKTLTKYIWEYLGNPIPSEIYGSETPETDDTTPPVIGNIGTTATATTATITWTTDESATGQVDYGVTADYGQQESQTSSATGHQFVLTGLQPGTTYHYQVASTDSSNNTSDSADFTFTTQSVSSGVTSAIVQDFEDTVVWVPGGSQDTTGNGRGWAFLDAGSGANIEIDASVGANNTQKSLKITFDSDNPQIYFRSDDKTTDLMPEAAGANRMSFYVRFPADFPIQPLPFRYDTWQLGTFIHDPDDWGDTHEATFEEDHGIHHYYHRVTIEQVGNGWVKYIVTTQPDQANYSGSTVPPNIPHYFDSLGRFYFHFGPEAGGPAISRPFTIWIDEIKFYYDDGSVGGQIHVGGQDDAGFDGEFFPDGNSEPPPAPESPANVIVVPG